MKLNAKQRLKATEVCAKCGEHHPEAVLAGRSQDWFHSLDDEVKAEYVQKYPGTKFRAKPNLVVPD